MTDAQALELVIHITSAIILAEAAGLIYLVFKLFKRLPKPSRWPIAMTGIVAFGVAMFALANLFDVWQVNLLPETIAVIRSMLMLLMGLPIWVILAMYDAGCNNIPPTPGKDPPHES